MRMNSTRRLPVTWTISVPTLLLSPLPGVGIKDLEASYSH